MTERKRNATDVFCQALLCLSLTIAPAAATDFEWDSGGAGNLWGTATNWNPDAIPGLSDRVLLTAVSLDGPQTIDLGGGTQRIGSITTNGVMGTYTFTNGTLELFGPPANRILGDTGGGNMVFDNDLLIAEAGEHLFNVAPSGGMITINGDLSTSATSGMTTLNLTSRNTSHSRSVTVNGVIRDNAGGAQIGLTAGFAGDLNHRATVAVTGLNTFTGPTRVNNVTLEFDSISNVGGAANALGQPALADSLIQIGRPSGIDARLRYVGSGHSSDREIRLEGSLATGTIESSGTGALTLSGNFSTVSSSSTRTLKLSGDNLGDNTYDGIIQAAAGTGRLDLVKEGVGKWILTGDNTMDGNTIVSAGELVLGPGGAIRSPVTGTGGTTVDVSSGGTLTLAGGTVETRDLDVAAGGTFYFRSGTLTHDAGESNFANDLVIGSDPGGSGGHMTVNASQGAGHVFKALTINDAGDSLTIDGGTTTVDSIDNSNGGALTMSGGTMNVNGGQITTGAGSLNTTVNGNGGLTKIGAGTLNMGAVTPAFSGPTHIQAGTLEVDAAGRLSDGSHITVDSGATLRLLTNTGDAVFGLSGAGHVDIGDAGFVLGNSVGPGSAGGVGTFSGTMTGTGSVEKRGLGTFTLDSETNYTGSTEIENGEMIVNGYINGTSEVRVVNGPLSGGGKLTINSGGAIRTTNFTGKVLAEFTGNGSLITLNGGSLYTGQLDLVNASGVYANSLTWNSGLIQINGPQGVRFGGGIDENTPFKESLTLDAGKTLDTFQGTIIASDGALTIDGGALYTSHVDNTAGGSFNFVSGALRLSGNPTLDAAYAEQLDIARPIQSGRQILVLGQATIETPIVVAGGSFRVGSVANPENLILDSGLFEILDSNLDIAANKSVNASLGMNVEVSAGALNVAATGSYNAISSTFSATAASTNDGTISAIDSTFTFDAGLANNGDMNLINTTINGSVSNSPSSSSTLVGVNSVSGDYTMSDNSSLQIDIMGTQAGQFDTLTVNGIAMLDGSLQVALQGGFTPASGDSFAIVSTGGGFGGGFDSLSLPTLGGGLSWQLNPGGNTVFLNVVGGTIDGDFDNDGDLDGADIDSLVFNIAGMTGDTSFDLTGDGTLDIADLQDWLTIAGAANLPSGNAYLMGDATLDGSVDGADFLAWNSSKFTSVAAWTAGDFNADGTVDGQDFLTWNTNKFTSADSFAQSVPEPTGLVICLFGVLIGWIGHNRS